MEKDSKPRNKVIILYILSRFPGITTGELTSMALDTCYMNYFTFATAFDDLCRNSLITRSVRKGEKIKDSSGNHVVRCDTTASGLEILNNLQHTIPEHVHSFINSISGTWEKSARKTVEVISTFDPDIFGGYDVRLSLSDGIKDLISLKLSIPTKDMSVKICNKWKENTQEMYLQILSFFAI